jgi:hypothetical protein
MTKENKNNTLTRSMKFKNINETRTSTFSTTTFSLQNKYNLEETVLATPGKIEPRQKRYKRYKRNKNSERLGQSFTVLEKTKYSTITSINLEIGGDKQSNITFIYLREYNGDNLDNSLDGKIIATSSRVNDTKYSSNSNFEIKKYDFPTRPLVESSKNYTFEIVNYRDIRSFFKPYTGGRAYFTLSTSSLQGNNLRFSVSGIPGIPFSFIKEEFKMDRQYAPSLLDLTSYATTENYLTIIDPDVLRSKIDTGYYDFKYNVEDISGVTPVRIFSETNGFVVNIPPNYSNLQVPVGFKLTISRLNFKTSANFIWI